MISRSSSLHKGVAYVFMIFPVPSEAFAGVELRALLDRGVEVSVYSLRPLPRKWESLIRERGLERISLVKADFLSYCYGLRKAIENPRVLFSLIKALVPGLRESPIKHLKGLALVPIAVAQANRIKQLNISNVHLFWGHYPSLVGMALCAMNARVKITMFLGAYDLEVGFSVSRALAKKVPVTTHAAINRKEISKFSGIAPKDVTLIYRGVRSKDIRYCPEKKMRRIVIAERLIHGKKTEDALRVFAGAVRIGCDAKLVVLGDGPERVRLRAIADFLDIDDKVEFLGHVPHAQVLNILYEAQVFLTMSRKPGERLPNAIKEAMASGCVPVISETPGIQELVGDGVNGFVVPEGEVNLASERIIQLFSDDELLERMARNARVTVTSRFDVEVLTDKRLEFFGLQNGAVNEF